MTSVDVWEGVEHMWQYAVKRFVNLIPILIGTTFVVFMVLHLSPGDPATFSLSGPPEPIDVWRERHGLNDHVLTQYIRYISGVFTGDLGISFRGRETPIAPTVIQHLPYTLLLSLASLLIAFISAIPIGIATAIKKNAWINKACMFIALIGISAPVFWVGLFLVLFFALRLEWLPPSGAEGWNSVILPSIALGSGILFAMVRSIRSSFIDIMEQDYIRTAHAKGLSSSNVIRKHALRNAIMPILKGFSANLSAFFTSIVLVEIVFARPGISRLFIQGVFARDYPMVLGCIVMFVLLYAIMNLLIDIAQALIDPRIRAQYNK